MNLQKNLGKLIAILLLASFFLFSGCSTDDDPKDPESQEMSSFGLSFFYDNSSEVKNLNYIPYNLLGELGGKVILTMESGKTLKKVCYVEASSDDPCTELGTEKVNDSQFKLTFPENFTPGKSYEMKVSYSYSYKGESGIEEIKEGEHVFAFRISGKHSMQLQEFDTASLIANDASGNIYASGTIIAEGGTDDVVICKYDHDQTLKWCQVFGTDSNETITDITVDVSKNSLVLAGVTYGNFPGYDQSGDGDVFVIKVNASTGGIYWQTQFGTSKYDEPRGIEIDRDGFIFVAGNTKGNLTGDHSNDENKQDVFIVKVTPDGSSLIEIKQIGNPESNEIATDALLDSNGHFFILVYGDTSFDGQDYPEQDQDAFMVVYNANSSGSEPSIFRMENPGKDYPTSMTFNDSEGIRFVGYNVLSTNDYSNAFTGKVSYVYNENTQTFEFSSENFALPETTDDDKAIAISCYDENCYVAINTKGKIGEGNAGFYDAAFCKINLDGETSEEECWQIGTNLNDLTVGILFQKDPISKVPSFFALINSPNNLVDDPNYDKELGEAFFVHKFNP